MAYRHSVIARTKSFYEQQQRLAPSIFSNFSTSHRDRDRDDLHTSCISRNSDIRFHGYISNRILKTRNNNSCNSQLRNVASQIGIGYGLVSHRNFSSSSGGEAACFEEVLNDVVGVVGEKAVEVAPVMNEVAVAAADSYLPVAALQYLVDHVHNYTGYNWWASIVVTTLLLRFLELPSFIQTWKTKAKRSGSVGAKKQDAKQVESGTNEFDAMVKCSLLLLSATSICFFFAILNMAEKVPSFVTGGTLWFTDLTTPDRMCLPILYASTIWMRSELTSRNLTGGQSKDSALRATSAAIIATFTVGLPKAIFCFLITSNLFSIVVMDPLLLKWFGISTNNKKTCRSKKKKKVQ